MLLDQMQSMKLDASDSNQLRDGPQMTLHAPEYQPEFIHPDINEESKSRNQSIFKLNLAKLKSSQYGESHNFEVLSSISADCSKSKSSMKFVGLTRVGA